MPFYTDLRNSLKSPLSLKWIEDSNKREVLAKLDDLTRPTMKWTPQVNRLSESQLKIAEKATTTGWQVYGVMQHVFTKHVALVLRSADHKLWGVLYHNAAEIERHVTGRLVLPMRKTSWILSPKAAPKSVSVKNKIVVCGNTGTKSGPVKASGFWAHIEA